MIPRKKIPTANPMFSRSRNSTKLFFYCVMQAEVRNPRWRLTNRNTYISACTQRSCKIPTAISRLSRSRNSMKLFLILCYASGSQIPRWRLTNTGNTHISACILRSCTILTAKLMYSRPRSAMQLCFISCNASGEHKSKMAAHKQEILISELVYNVAAQLQRLYPWFPDPGCQ